jgi:hypothetical protein
MDSWLGRFRRAASGPASGCVGYTANAFSGFVNGVDHSFLQASTGMFNS